MGLAAEGLGARSASSLPFEASSGMPTVRLTSPCCPPGAVEEEPKTLERSIEARLDKLSEQMDAVLAEVMGLKNSTPPSGPDVKAPFWTGSEVRVERTPRRGPPWPRVS